VKQAKTTVTYRFSLPEEPRSCAPATVYSAARCVRIPVEAKTVGDHLRRKRLSVKLLQKDVAERIGADKCLINNWEGNHSNPHLQYMPAIIRVPGLQPAAACDELGGTVGVHHGNDLSLLVAPPPRLRPFAPRRAVEPRPRISSPSFWPGATLLTGCAPSGDCLHSMKSVDPQFVSD